MLKSRKFWIFLVDLPLAVCVIACAAFIILTGLADNLYNQFSSDAVVGVGRPAPEFELAAISGETIRLSQFRGRPVMLSFSASWCPSCREEAPILQAIHERHPDLAMLLVDYGEDAATAQAFARDFGMTFPVILDTEEEVGHDYRIYVIPSVFLVDSKGVIRTRFIGMITVDGADEALDTLASGGN